MGISYQQQKRNRFRRAAKVFPGMTWEVFQQLEMVRGVYDEDRWAKLMEAGKLMPNRKDNNAPARTTKS